MLFLILSFKQPVYAHDEINPLTAWVVPMRILAPEHGNYFSSRETAHAQTKYKDNRTSGRGARASYRTMFPDISAR